MLEELELVPGGHVGEHNEGHLGQFRRQAHLPVFEHIDRDMMGGAVIHILEILTTPGEGSTLRTIHTLELHPVALQHGEVLRGIIVPNNAHQVNRIGEVAGSEGGI